MATWTTPKTDWVATDYFKAEDYNRIMNNILFLKDLATNLFGQFDIDPMDGNKTYTDIPYARNINDIENNLDAINQHTYNLPIGTKMNYVSNGNVPLFTEYNRIESSMLLLYTWFMTNGAITPHIAFTLGNAKIKGIKRTKYDKNEVIAYRFGIDLGLERGFRP